ncbi:MAG: hypothetical protein ACJAX5_000600 [Patiriisocius sp.]
MSALSLKTNCWRSTADHQTMQRQGVKQGFDTGLMLGYIPLEIRGQVGEKIKTLRSAATIVYEPLNRDVSTQKILAPPRYRQLIDSIVQASGIPRALTKTSVAGTSGMSATELARR